ncbi:heterokaryon incompatibility protein-domain-containing protein [Lophiotrema nucula]|uniref:Heterokaryon incompatibility protein-domain-containing protein n=1 Tax=Lophiotrema nucula TaxID=690887 RepID=A0A6A5ZWS6_9PLEO|nr:heterokaryon incompatibility protein-domain-containing protein [Lophiotrema nucula]
MSSDDVQSITKHSYYKYKPIPPGGWFRLLRLKPGKADKALRFELFTEDLQHKPRFQAISYVWGSPQGTIPVECDGKVLLITPSLEAALLCVRDATSDVILWADAICINQESVAEKNHQVNLMAMIYERANRVLVWLGKDVQDDARDAFALIKETNQYFELGLTKYGHVDQVPTISPESSILSIDRWLPLQKLFDQPWFSRVWCIQEIGLAKTAIVLYGSRSIQWSELIQFILLEYRRPELQAIPVTLKIGRTIDAFNLLWCTYGNFESWKIERPYIQYLSKLPHHASRSHFFNLLLTGARFNATDGRDHVYAFLGHPSAVNKNNRRIFEADYSLDIDEVHHLVATALLELTGSLLILSAAEQTIETLESDFPSWIPRWNNGNRSVLLSPYPGQNYYYSACSGMEDSQDFEARPSHVGHPRGQKVSQSTLRVRGIFVAAVHATAEVLHREELAKTSHESNETTSRRLNPLEEAWNMAKKAAAFKHEDGLCDFSLTVTAGLDRHRQPATPDLGQHWNNFEAFCASKFSETFNEQHSAALKHQIPKADGGEEKMGNAQHFFVAARQICHGRRVFMTDKGSLGLGPAPMQKEDLCCVLVGARVPFVLRSTRTPGHYRVVGECYLQGYMEGKAVDEMKSGNLDLENFVLA